MNTQVLVSFSVIEKSVLELQSAGQRRSEHVVLWLGRADKRSIHVEVLWVPEQRAGYDFFEIPEAAMARLFHELRTRRLMVAAQVHTHPRRAFHSYADDRWAIVRHVGALSLVIPHFSLRTNPESFRKDAALFVLSSNDEWLEVAMNETEAHYKIIP